MVHIVRQYPVQEKTSKPLTTTSATSIKVLRKSNQEILTDSSSNAQKSHCRFDAKSFVSVLNQYSLDEQPKAGGIPKAYVPLKDLQESAPPLYAAVTDLKRRAH